MVRARKPTDPDKGKKKVTISLLKRLHAGKLNRLYRVLDVLCEQYHAHVGSKRIAILWDMAPSLEDVDGRKKLGKVQKCSDADREFAPEFDFRITLTHEVWNNAAFTEDMVAAALDHYLCRIAVCKDKHGEDRVDTKGRTVYRIRRPPSEFSEVVARHGMWNPDLAKIASCEQSFNDRPKNRPLFRLIGDDEVAGEDGAKRKQGAGGGTTAGARTRKAAAASK